MGWAPHVTVAAVVERDGHFLLVEEEVDGTVVLNQPAGHLDPGESLPQAAAREALEETGWPFRPTGIVGLYRWEAPSGRTYLRLAFCGELDDSGPRGPLDRGILGTRWLAAEAVRAAAAGKGPLPLRSPLVLRAVEDHLAGHRWPLDLVVDVP